ncbi:MAG: hypothetical protein AB7O96_14825 [Pseudobdellovibrionaceae bacterium]
MSKKVMIAILFFGALGCATKPVSREPSGDISESLYVHTLCKVSSLSPTNGETPEFKACMNMVNKSFATAPPRNRYEIALLICESPTAGTTFREKAYPRSVCDDNAVGLIKNETLTREAKQCASTNKTDEDVARIRGNCLTELFNKQLLQ